MRAIINKGIKKIDSNTIVQGKPIYTEDLIYHRDTLTVKLLRSPYAFAKITKIDTSKALEVPGVVAIYTYKDVPKVRYTMAGESYPEVSPQDQLILEDTVRYVGDEVAIIAAIDEVSAVKAMKLIKVEYEKLTPIFDPKESEDNESIIHSEDDIFCGFDFGCRPNRNIVSTHNFEKGNVEEEFKNCDVIIEKSYETSAQAHCMMETHRAHTYIDEKERLVVISATQSPYHIRRQISKAVGIPLSKLRVIKPRVGGAFGGKNIAIAEIYASFVTWNTKKPAKLIYTREETFMATNTRHPMHFNIKLGSDKEGNIKAIDMKVLNNTGAYGGNGPAVTMVSGHNVLPTYNDVDAIRFNGKTVYTNIVPAGPLRGYGATQGTFALDSAINELATELNMDPSDIKLKNIIKNYTEGGITGTPLRSCELDQSIKKGKELIGWDSKYPKIEMGNNKVKSVGMAVATHGSGIAFIDISIVTARMDEDGTYKLFTGSADLGTGSDTILSQIAAESLNTNIDKISIYSGDSDTCPYDTGASASSTTYVTGNAVLKACESLKRKLLTVASRKLRVPINDLILEEDRIKHLKRHDIFIFLKDIGISSVGGGNQEVLMVTESHGIEESPKPFIAGFVEIELDKSTGEYKVLNYVAIPDCGTVINPTLARVQVEGGITTGIGLTMYEDPKTSTKGKMLTSNFLQYKIPTRKDIGNIIVEFAQSYEPSGPYGAKSLGEIVVHTPAPAIANAIYNAVGVNIRSLPITAEKVYLEMKKHNK